MELKITIDDKELPPPSEWDQFCEDHPTSELNQLADVISEHLVRLARLSAYLEERAYYGGSHNERVKAQNKAAAKIRRALGYTYPKQDFNF